MKVVAFRCIFLFVVLSGVGHLGAEWLEFTDLGTARSAFLAEGLGIYLVMASLLFLLVSVLSLFARDRSVWKRTVRKWRRQSPQEGRIWCALAVWG
ncbi:MAG: hypothetical protein ACI8X5_002982 [Planctomycetota bacterium]|jgi:hypothetical protein